jgi:protease I
MMDDLRAVGAIVPDGARAVRDGQIVTAIFPHDLPAFFRLIFEGVTELEGRPPPAGYPSRLSGQSWGIVIDDASDATQVQYLKLRIEEEGGQAILLGRRAGQAVKLSSPAWEWAELGWHTTVERPLPNPATISSCDGEAEANSQAITTRELDGILLPGGLATWMIRGHPGLCGLIEEMNALNKPVAAIERGPKLLLMTDVLPGRTITCAPQMRDDVIYATAPITYCDQPIHRDRNLLTAQTTEDLPEFVHTLIASFGSD